MTQREQRVVDAFVNLVKSGEYSYDYASAMIEKQDSYGFLTDEAKQKFYGEIGQWLTSQESAVI